jgi:endoglucanase
VKRSSCLLLAMLSIFVIQVNAQTISSYAMVTGSAQQYTKVEFNIAVSGSFSNAYNAAEISLDMMITSPAGVSIDQPCYYNSGTSPNSNWVARFTPKEVGNYTYYFQLTESGTVVATSSSSSFTTSASSKNGFLHIAAGNDWILQFDNGKPFKGIGMDYAWQPRNYESQKYIYSYMIPKLATNGANFFRTWMCPWNLPLEWKTVTTTNFYTNSTQYFNPSAIAGMDSLVNLAEANGMYMMLTLNTFGDLIDQWSTNNYNAVNGGPCSTPNDFFANAAAKAMFKNRLRYIIARWGYSTSIAAFELFNEIDNAVYGITPNLTQSDVTQWHTDMSAYIKSIDPYGHMVTTSISYQNITGLNAVPSFDFNQQHIYSDPSIGDIILNIPTTIRSYEASTGKPYSIGEYGYDWRGPDTTLGAQNDSNFHQGLWYGLFSPTPIAPMSWWWEMFDNRGTTTYFHNIQDISNKMIASGGGNMTDLTINGNSSLEKYGAKCGNDYYIYSRNKSAGTLTTNLTVAVSGSTYDVTIYNTTTGAYADQGIISSSGGILSLPGLVLGSGSDVILIAKNTTAVLETPYGGTATNIPGTIQAENYDIGGEGVAYHDVDAANQGGAYRTDGVDIQTTTDAGGGYNVGYIAANEWLNYTVNVTASGKYNIGFRTAGTSSLGVLRMFVDSVNVTGDVSLPNTSDWQTWVTTTVTNVNLTAGQHVIKIFFVTGGFNLNYITVSAPSSTPGYLHASGKNIINNNGNFVIKAINIGDFMIQEGYMMNMSGSQYIYKQKIAAMIGQTACDQFYANYYQNFVTKADIDSIAKWGFNSIRLPLHYELFTPLGQPTVFLTQGFAIVDSILSWCKTDKIYLILDLHAAPGGENSGDISDYNPAEPSLWESTDNQNQTIALWKELATHYANEQYIGGYDLINETDWTLPNNTLLMQLMQNITTAIRQVDNNHILFIEGNNYANDYTGMTPAWDNNMAYEFHKYWNDNTAAAINFALSIRDGQNVPIWMGEFGENSNNWDADALTLVDQYNIGWAIWPYKKMSSVSCISSFNQPSNWTTFANYVNGGAQPSATTGQAILNELLNDVQASNCTINYGYLYALFKQPGNTNTIPYNNTATSLPGRITAAYYDEGKDGYAYSDSLYQNTQYGSAVGSSTSWNNGWAYRNDGVDLEYSTAENGPTVGWTETNDWMQYTVNAIATGTYTIKVRAAGFGGKLSFSVDGTTVFANYAVASTGGWDTWQTFTLGTASLTAGAHIIRATVTTPGYNLSYFDLSATQVTITAPANNATFTAPATITINASATSSTGTISKVDFYNGATLIGTDNTSPYTFTWNNVAAGTYSLTAKSTDNLNAVLTSAAVNITVTSAATESPYGGTAWPIPGTIQAENFDLGGEGIAYHDSDATNNGAQYRLSDGVDIEATTDAGGGYDVGWTYPGEWMQYMVNVTEAGIYTLQARVASILTGQTFYVTMDGVNISGTMTVPNTGAYQTWQTISITTPMLTAGQHKMRVVETTGGYNLNYFTFLVSTAEACASANNIFVAAAPIPGNTYQWQVSTNNGSSYTNISNGALYSGVGTDTLTLNSASSTMYGYLYRCTVNGSTAGSQVATLKFADTWIGTINNAWETAGNWSCGIVPDANTDVIISSGTPVINSIVNIRSLELDPSAILTVSQSKQLNILH